MDSDFVRSIENCVTNGKVLMIEDIGEHINTVLDSILYKNYLKRNEDTLTVKLGENDIDFNTNFRLYLTTKLANPHLSPDIFLKANVINFTVTLIGLKD